MSSRLPCIVASLFALSLTTPSRAQDHVETFYKGRNLELIVGYGPGGGYDVYARALAPFFTKHLPGAPQTIVRNMPGASSLTALRHIAQAAPRDGSLIGTFNPTLVVMSALEGDKAQVSFKSLTWIGNMSSDTKVCMVRESGGLQRLEELKIRNATIGATGQGSGHIYGLILRQLYSDNIKIVMGYPSTNDIALAMERGEVDGMCTGWGVVEVTKPDWIRRGFVNVLTQFSSHRDKRLPNVPVIHESSLPSGMSEAITFLTTPDMVTRPFIAPPLLPRDRSDALRAAFNKAMKDPDLHAYAQKMSLDLDPMTGDDLENLISRVFSASAETLDFARKVLK